VLFAYAFAKNAAATLTPPGQAALTMVGAAFLAATDQAVQALLVAGDVTEVDCDAEDQA
jgi:hypothetical protein